MDISLPEVEWKSGKPKGWDVACVGQTAHHSAIVHKLHNSDLDVSTLLILPDLLYL